MDPVTKAITNRSIRTIRIELEFLADNSLLSSSQLASIIKLLPDPSSSSSASGSQHPPTTLANTSISEKQPANFITPSPSPAPPPAYGGLISIATASAIYAYAPTDAGDLALQPNDHIQILEYMNTDWAKGRNERTGLEGIFPRSYVNVVEEKNISQGGMMVPPLPTPQQGNNYGNVPLVVSQSGGGGGGGHSKLDENGKKFGKKLGNAGKSSDEFLSYLCVNSRKMPDGLRSDLRSWGDYWIKYCQRDILEMLFRMGLYAIIRVID